MHPPLLPDLHPICKDVSVAGFARDPHRRSCTPGLVCMAPRFSAAVAAGLPQAIIALIQCHKDNKYAKFWGACNDVDFALTRCLTEEKKILR